MPYIDSRTSDLMRTVNDYRCHPSSRWRAGEITENTVRSESVKFQMPSQVTFDTVPSSLIWNLTIGDRAELFGLLRGALLRKQCGMVMGI